LAKNRSRKFARGYGSGQTAQRSLGTLAVLRAAGTRQTTLAFIIAREMGSIFGYIGTAIERAGDLASLLTNLNHGDVLFIDEIHRLNKVVEEVLYPAWKISRWILFWAKARRAQH